MAADSFARTLVSDAARTLWAFLVVFAACGVIVHIVDPSPSPKPDRFEAPSDVAGPCEREGCGCRVFRLPLRPQEKQHVPL